MSDFAARDDEEELSSHDYARFASVVSIAKQAFEITLTGDLTTASSNIIQIMMRSRNRSDYHRLKRALCGAFDDFPIHHDDFARSLGALWLRSITHQADGSSEMEKSSLNFNFELIEGFN